MENFSSHAKLIRFYTKNIVSRQVGLVMNQVLALNFTLACMVFYGIDCLSMLKLNNFHTVSYEILSPRSEV